MCCGNEHDNDPKYKRARCCACFNLAGEITFLLTLCWAIFAAALAILYMCGLHAAVSSSSSSSTSSSTSYWQLQSTGVSCTKKEGTCGEDEFCYAKCNYNTCPNVAKAESYATADSDAYHDSSYNKLCEYDFTCSLSETGYENCGKCPKQQDGMIAGGECYKRSRRRLSFIERHAIALYDTTLESVDKHARFVSESMNKHARLLSESQSDADRDYEEVKKHAKNGCDSGRGFYVACYGGFFFGLISLIFASINVCNCCKGCCGGFQGQFRCLGIYSIVSAVWQLVCMGLLAILLSSVAGMNNMWLKYCKDSGSSTDCETSDGFMLVRAIETSLAVCMAVAVFVFLGRLLTAIFSLIASNEVHSSQKTVQVEVPMQRVVVQQVPVVVKNPQQNYV